MGNNAAALTSRVCACSPFHQCHWDIQVVCTVTSFPLYLRGQSDDSLVCEPNVQLLPCICCLLRYVRPEPIYFPPPPSPFQCSTIPATHLVVAGDGDTDTSNHGESRQAGDKEGCPPWGRRGAIRGRKGAVASDCYLHIS